MGEISPKPAETLERIEITPEMIEAGVVVYEEWLSNIDYGSESNGGSELVKTNLFSALTKRTVMSHKLQRGELEV